MEIVGNWFLTEVPEYSGIILVLTAGSAFPDLMEVPIVALFMLLLTEDERTLLSVMLKEVLMTNPHCRRDIAKLVEKLKWREDEIGLKRKGPASVVTINILREEK